jgi:hypothetical protein
MSKGKVLTALVAAYLNGTEEDREKIRLATTAAIDEEILAKLKAATTIRFKPTDFGFEWGAVTVTRCISDDTKGFVAMSVKTAKTELQVYVTKTGKMKIRVFNYTNGHEWIESKEDRRATRNKKKK